MAKAEVINLNTDTFTITNKKIKNPSSVRCSYGLWVYVNSWSLTDKVICTAQVPNTIPNFKLYLDAKNPTLKCDIRTIKNNTIQSVTVTNNFPIQRWVYIVISIDGPVVDCYLDGKLVKSQQITDLPNMSGLYDISCGKFDAYITSLSRDSAASDPQTVWNNYMTGNGYTSFSSNYGFAVSVTKDNKEVATYKY
jgi:hypothetical protein